MTKADIINRIVKTTGVEKDTVANVLEAFMDCVKSSVSSGEDVFLRKFGTFHSKHRAEKTARNILRNTSIIVPAHNVPAFKPSIYFKSAVKGE